jgi:hypothetical protein
MCRNKLSTVQSGFVGYLQGLFFYDIFRLNKETKLMKIRRGFVSNSSSTSFVIHAGESNVPSLKQRIKQLIEDDAKARRTGGADERVVDPLTFAVQPVEGGCRIEFPLPFYDDQNSVLPDYIQILIDELGDPESGFEDKNRTDGEASGESSS